MKPIHFFSEPIQVHFNQPPMLEKKPGAPDSFTWRGETYIVVEILQEFIDYSRKGRMSKNMIPAHTATASRRGSWGVGTFTFRVRTDHGRIFDIYYDRAPKDVDSRKGEWFLFQELAADE